jgi:hypothetical protein
VLHEQLCLIRAYDASGAWRHDGAASMAAWACFALGVTSATGAEYVRVARTLGDLPLLSAALAGGWLCYEQVRALTTIATAGTEASLVAEAQGMTASQAEVLVRRLRAVPTDEASTANASRSLRLRWGPEDRMLRLSGRFPDADGAVIASAIEGLVERSASPDDPEREPFDARCADALVELCSCPGGAEGPARFRPRSADDDGSGARGHDGGIGDSADSATAGSEPRGARDDARAEPVRRTEAEPVRAEIVAHVEAGVLASGGDGAAALECGPPVASETVRRLACDGWIRAVIEGPDRPLGVGRRQRTVPRSLLRVLRHRDGGCRFPGCTRTRWVQAHHITFWADGGRTDVENLVLLRGAHHRFVHEGGWRVEGDPAGELRFVHPDGRELRVGPPGLRAEVAERFGFRVGEEAGAGPAEGAGSETRAGSAEGAGAGVGVEDGTDGGVKDEIGSRHEDEVEAEINPGDAGPPGGHGRRADAEDP